MNQYHKIPGLWKRESDKPYNLLEGIYREPEFEFLKDCEWDLFEKIDGTNIRVIWDGENIELRGKSDNAQLPHLLSSTLVEQFLTDGFEAKVEELFNDTPICIYGEGYGSKIQNGGDYFPEYPEGKNEFIAFDVKVNDTFLDTTNYEQICGKLGIRTVTKIGTGTLEDASAVAKNGFRTYAGEHSTRLAEGLVCKPSTTLYNKRGNRIICKIKTKDWQ